MSQDADVVWALRRVARDLRADRDFTHALELERMADDIERRAASVTNDSDSDGTTNTL